MTESPNAGRRYPCLVIDDWVLVIYWSLVIGVWLF